MTKSVWLLSAALCAITTPALAQTDPASAPDAAAPASTSVAPASADPGDIVVTATQRATPLGNVPIAVTAVSAAAFRNSGGVDIRGLNQLTPSLLVSSSSSEAVGGAARIRGIGTVGDNPGLESSVATFVDGVYRSRSGVAFTELGPIDRIEVLRGPQGTLFGRNVSAGLINIVTAAPSFTEGGHAEASYGNYDYKRGVISLTGPIDDTIAYRIDGVYTKRDGFMKESGDYAGSEGRRFNNRNRWLVRGQLLFKPSDDLSVRIIGDYARRNEQCCAASFAPASNAVRNPDGSVGTAPSSFAALEGLLGGVVNDDTYQRRVSVTPGRSFKSDVRDMGLSGQVDWDLGGARLTSITAYRDWKSARAQDGDFSNLDIIYRDALDQRFRTFTQELRLQGKAFGDRLDWLVGGYFENETLTLRDNLRFGDDYGLLEGCRIVAGTALAPFLAPGQAGCLSPAGQAAALAAVGPTLRQGLYNLAAITASGASQDRFHQRDRNYALFTHDVVAITDSLSLTLGARYTHDAKTLDAAIASDTTICPDQSALLGATAASPASPPGARSLASSLISLSCSSNIGGGVDGVYHRRRSDNQWTGTAVLAFKPTDRMLTYASFSRGYKAGGFNLDRAGLLNPATTGAPFTGFPSTAAAASQLDFKPEKVDAFELGAKYRGRGFRLAAAAFYEMFDNFQLNTFNGVSFLVENIEGCSALDGGSGADSDILPGTAAAALTGSCAGKRKSGVTSRGIELEASVTPVAALSFDLGATLADTRYRHDLVGAVSQANPGGTLPPALFQLPGSRLSNAPEYTVTSSVTWTPRLSDQFGGLVHLDVRYQSRINTGSDLLPEKLQRGVAIVNGRIGLTGPDMGWSLELWAQNLFDTNYRQVVAGAPLQGSGSIATVAAGGASPGTSLFIVFPAEPRTFGVTVRTDF